MGRSQHSHLLWEGVLLWIELCLPEKDVLEL